MRRNFFIAVGIVVAIGAVLFFLWQVIATLYSMYTDFRSRQQLDEMAAEHAERRRRLREENRKRLDNGCDHQYEDLIQAFPPGVCVKCGIAKDRPAGACDHVWERVPGPIPGSKCKKCGEVYGPVASA